MEYIYSNFFVRKGVEVNLINPLRAKFFRGNLNIYSYFVSFLHIDTTQVFEILPQNKTGTHLFYIVNIMASDVLAT